MSGRRAAVEAKVEEEWFASWFNSPYYHTLYAHRDENEAAGLIDRLVDRLRPRDGEAALDLGCGAGRHARRLAARNLDVTGVDLSVESIARARVDARDNLRFIRQDMREPLGVSAFDYVFSLFTSFGYFDELSENQTVLHNVALALKPAGVLVLDYLNVRYAEARRRPYQVVERGDAVYRITRWSDAAHLFKRIIVETGRGDGRLEYVERVAKLTLDDLRFMLAVCDMNIEAVYGDYQLQPFEPERSPRLMLVARKSPSAIRPAAGQLPPDSADGLRSHSEVGGEHRLRHALDD
jgi:SAM-dependent methyltransferase